MKKIVLLLGIFTVFSCSTFSYKKINIDSLNLNVEAYLPLNICQRNAVKKLAALLITQFLLF